MPPSRKYTREDIIECSYKIVEEEGIASLNARNIARKLHSSIQPIFHNFTNMEELRNAVFEKISQTYQDYLFASLDTDKPYRQIGINYIRFAKEKPNLFHVLFMSPSTMTKDNFGHQDESIQKILEVIKQDENVTENLKDFHFKMWIFTHGIAVLIVSGMCHFTDEEISSLLTNEYQSLLKGRKMKNEKDK